MTPKKKEHDRDADAAVADGGGAGEPAAEEGAPAATEGAVAEVVAPADGTDAADPGLGVQPGADAGAVNPLTDPDHGTKRADEPAAESEQPAAEPSSWERLAQRQS